MFCLQLYTRMKITTRRVHVCESKVAKIWRVAFYKPFYHGCIEKETAQKKLMLPVTVTFLILNFDSELFESEW